MPTTRKRTNAKYKVNIQMRAWDIAKAGAGITLKVRDRSRLLGTIEIGQGSLRWKPSYAHEFKRIPWRRLADALNNL